MIEIVRDGYRRLGGKFDEWRNHIAGDPRRAWRELLASKLEPGARVLELGCGNGDDARALALLDFEVTGVDLVARAEGVTVIEADFLEVQLPERSYEAVVSFYAFNHVPREKLGPLLRKIHSWLVPGGALMAAFGTGDTEAWRGEWLGVPMFFSSYPPETNSRLVREAGFEVVRDEVVEFQEPEGEVRFQWVLARSI
ncbi:MAG TPA: methyltransferase domain-containing protein [Gaiellaceae bacterium]|nr:methyltransferase domain-containing protein [Gaiellaceae bacterium]